ncbi:hypothetical protein CXB51_004822 [Gossypium anomalum]|uniref:RNase H type-1 domain-containing protein n=1 Tax=Gossypium anomalum TaxID=47600 RepID=A0A8J6D9C5_9ROSI|nr:hypothetical protein CXB51_004822 [Gossypium anomalum]
MGFQDDWVSQILNCVTSVSYFVVINGKQGDCFRPSRGFCQGDPLSPYLYLICREGFSSLLKRSCNEGTFRGIKASRGGPLLAHLFIANDSFIFGQTTVESVCTIGRIIDEFASCLDQCINYETSTIFFNSNTSENTKAMVVRELGLQIIFCLDKYLGLPPIVAIPIYAMSCFLLPKSLFHDVESIISKFCWQKDNNQRGIHWTFEFRRPVERSIWSARGLLEKGLKWHIGSGNNMSIWENYWISGANLAKSKHLQLMIAEDILCIPLASVMSDDRLVWRSDNTGLYTVKSGYRLLQSNNGTEIQLTDKALYNNIWQLQGWRMSSMLSVPVYLCITCLGSSVLMGCDSGKIHTGDDLVTFVEGYCLELSMLQSRMDRHMEKHLNRWKPPKDPILKVNFDASFCENTNKSSTGVVIRNGKGLVMGTCIILNVNVPTPFATEALACLQSMAFARDLGLDKVFVEGDSLTVTKKASQGNMVVNLLARLGKDYGENTFWVEDGVEKIYRLLEEDRHFLRAE